MARRRQASLLGDEPQLSARLSDEDLWIAFDLFWTLFPRGDGKQAAKKAWKLHVQTPETITAIMAALAWQIHRPEWQPQPTGQSFVPHASTWLNNARWEDERRSQPRSTKWYDDCRHQPRCEDQKGHNSLLLLDQTCQHQPRCQTWIDHGKLA